MQLWVALGYMYYCGGPVEPVDGSWHVTWVVDGEARPEMPDF